ncbi:SLC13 family permease [Candidatus Berkiella aquae]|uniref:Anion permease n=1 Tax=Candidatus Berkiella aquae TaxID=295108 RepID=A0A0Q9Z130_9GAMM|nr:SLC13 family permease [Candidatus Berkiella aquae]MCS5712618.1 anion permease [Candidatus Berkiella aquae]
MLGVHGLTPDIFLVVSIIVVTMILFVTEVVRVDVVAFLVLVLLGLTRLVPSDALFSGFSSDAVIALIGVMIISAGLERSGVVAKMAYYIMRLGGSSENRIRLYLMGVSGFCAGFLRSVSTVALLLPIITRIRQVTGIAKSRLLLPLSFCAILGSTLTMLGTGPLILLNSLLINSNGLTDKSGVKAPALGLFSVFPIGLALLVMGIIYFILLGKWVLPKAPLHVGTLNNGGSPGYFKRVYGIGADFCECRVPASSSLVDNTLRQWEWLLPPTIAIIGIKIGNNLHMPPLRKTEIKANSVIAMFGPKEEVEEFAKKYGLRMSPYLTAFPEHISPPHAGLCEAVVPPSSRLLGTNFGDLHMRREYGIQVLAVHRGDKVRRGKKEIGGLTLRAGDTLGMFCQWNSLGLLQKNPDFVIVTTDYPRKKMHTDKMWFAVFFFVLSIALIIFSDLSVSIGLLVGAVGMIFSGVISIDDAYEAVSWKTVFLLAGLIPLGIAVQTSGTSDWMGAYILKACAGYPEWILLLILGVIASIGSIILSNVGATIVLVPLAVHLAQILGDDPRAFALMVAIATSNSFIVPTHQANALISLPGEYKIMDFIKAGGLMSFLYLIVVMLMIKWMF